MVRDGGQQLGHCLPFAGADHDTSPVKLTHNLTSDPHSHAASLSAADGSTDVAPFPNPHPGTDDGRLRE